MLLLTTLLAMNLNGVWVRPCNQGQMQIQFFEAEKNYSDDLFFQDQACQKPLMSFSYDGLYQLRTGEMDYQFSRVSITVYSNELLQNFKTRKVCGFTNWSLNSPREITGLRCAFFSEKEMQVPNNGEGRFGIWKVENRKLYFGKLTPSHPATSPETRPIEWDPRPYFKQL